VQSRELANVPEPARRQIRRLQRLYVEERVTVLSELVPSAPQARLRTAVHAMFGLLNSTYKRELRFIGFGLLGSDPRLAAQLNLFCRLTAGQSMPTWEQVPSRRDRSREAATLIAMALAIAVAVVSLMLSTYTKTGRRNARSKSEFRVNDG
jgi:hypothetical protein